MPTIIIGKMEIELPAMYIMNRFIGICLNGPRAMSQDFCREMKYGVTVAITLIYHGGSFTSAIPSTHILS